MSIKAIIYCNDNSLKKTPEIEARHDIFLRHLLHKSEINSEVSSFQVIQKNFSKENNQDKDRVCTCRSFFANRKQSRSLLRKANRDRYQVIAVDGGANILCRRRFLPDLIIGDMDSIKPEVLDFYEGITEIKKFPTQKDKTDTELALDWCIEQQIEEVIILNTLLGSFAHSFGNIMLLFKARSFGLKTCVYNFRDIIFLVPDILTFQDSNSSQPGDKDDSGDTVREWRYSGQPERKISLIPLTEQVSHIETTGLGYPLKGETLYRNSTRGLNNVFIDEQIKVCYRDGELIGVMETTPEEVL